MKRRVAIIGSGPSGLVCAHALQKKGYEVVVFEKENTIGGRMQTYTRDGYVFNSGATMLIDYYFQFLALSKEFAIDQQLIFKNPGCQIKVGDCIQPVENGSMAFLKLQYLPWRQRIRLLFWIAIVAIKAGKNNLFDPIKPSHPYYQITAQEFFAKHFDQRTIEITLGTLVSSITLMQLHEITLKDMIDSFKTGQNSKVCFFPTGIVTLCQELAKRLNVFYSNPVKEVRSENGKLLVFAKDRCHEFDRVVLAVPPRAALEIYPPTSTLAALNEAKFVATIRLAFIVPLLPFKEYDFVIFPMSESSLITGCNCSEDIAKIGKTRLVPESRGIMAICIRDAPSQELLNAPDEKIFKLVREELCRLLPQFRQVDHEIKDFHLHRWQDAVPIRQARHIKANNHFWIEEQGKNNVYFCGDYLNTYWVEGSIRSGLAVASLLSSRDVQH